MITYLKRPSPIEYTAKLRLILSLGIPLFIFVFLVIFRPFQLFDAAQIDPIIACAGFAFISSLCIALMVFGWSLKLIQFFKEKWSIGLELTSIFLLVTQIGVLNHLFIVKVVSNDYYAGISDVSGFLISLGMTYSVGFFPIVFLLIAYELTWRTQANPNYSVNLVENSDLGVTFNTVVIEALTKENTLELSSESFLFAKAAGNYVEYYSHIDGKVRKDLQRMTLAKLEEIFLETQFPAFKTHRGYIVNHKKVLRYEGNAQGYSLDFGVGLEKVPVSRKQIPQFDRVMKG